MAEYQDKIKDLEDELKKTKYNKRTQHHVGLVKAKLAILKEKEIKRSAGKKGEGFSVRKSGDATVVLVGFPSVGKSSLLNALTKANSPVGAYAFTTLDVIPGLLEYKHAKIQVLDVPGIVYGAATGRGRGREVLAVMRSADMVLILIDVHHPEHLEALKKEIFDSGLRINQQLPDMKIAKKSKGGLSIATTTKLTNTDKETIADIIKEFRTFNADVVIRQDITQDQVIDVIEGNKVYLPALVLLNKIDMVGNDELERIKKKVRPDLCVSAQDKTNIEELKDMIFNTLDLMRVYCKESGKKADLDVPLIMKSGSTLKDMCEKLHKDFITKFKFARIWGPSAKFGGQKLLKLGHVLKDKDTVEMHLR